MTQETGWDNLIHKLHTNEEEEASEETSYLPPYHQIPQPNMHGDSTETKLVEKYMLTANKTFVMFRVNDLKTLKIVSLQNLTRFSIFNQHLYQVSDFKIMEDINQAASCDISGLLLVYSIYFNQEDSIETKILMKGKIISLGKFEDKLCQPLNIEWKTKQSLGTFNVNEISVWSFNNSSLNPSNFQTQEFESGRILDIKFSKFVPAIYVQTVNSVILLNSIYLTKIREFKPSKKEKISQLFIFKNAQQKNRDLLITISNKGVLKVWDLTQWQEERKKFNTIQKINIPSQSLTFQKEERQEISTWARFDQKQQFLFLLAKLDQIYLQILHVDSVFLTKINDGEMVSSDQQKRLFIRKMRFQLPGQDLKKITLIQINNSQSYNYFQNHTQKIEDTENDQNQDYCLFTMNASVINIHLIQGEDLILQDEQKQEDSEGSPKQKSQQNESCDHEKSYENYQNSNFQQNQDNQSLQDEVEEDQKSQKSQQKIDANRLQFQDISQIQTKDQINQENELVTMMNNAQNKNLTEENEKQDLIKYEQEFNQIRKESYEQEQDNLKQESYIDGSNEEQDENQEIILKPEDKKAEAKRKKKQAKKEKKNKDKLEKEKQLNQQIEEITMPQKVEAPEKKLQQKKQPTPVVPQVPQKKDQEQINLQEIRSKNIYLDKLQIISKDGIEQIISQSIEKVFQEQNFTQLMESEIQGQIDYTMKQEFQHNFDNQITPSFERYLESMYQQIANNFDQGLNFYEEKINQEKQKNQQIKEAIDENFKNFTKINQVIHQFFEQSIQNVNLLDQKISQKESSLQEMVDQMKSLQQNQESMDQKIIKLESLLSQNSQQPRQPHQIPPHNQMPQSQQIPQNTQMHHSQQIPQNNQMHHSQQMHQTHQEENTENHGQFSYQDNRKREMPSQNRQDYSYSYQPNYPQHPHSYYSHPPQYRPPMDRRMEDSAYQNVMSALEHYHRISHQEFKGYERPHYPYDYNRQ